MYSWAFDWRNIVKVKQRVRRYLKVVFIIWVVFSGFQMEEIYPVSVV
jgi:hypothetical protein